MYIQQVELTRGVGREFVKALRDMSKVEEYAQGDILFRKGDTANHTYLLLIGRVHLKIGEIGHVIHIVSRPGETFGWSSLVKRDVYSSTTECVLETNVRKLHRDDLQKLLKPFLVLTQLQGPLLNPCFQFVAGLAKRLFS